ncbi:MAG: hypothetical protein HN725_04080 [Alphaproteobacteria bacterium]|jgi:hypothetical protein|nr:hypothetical protein [Alphaproteobacteria bacterium]MBT4085812.1 hypothetical protein [Alphaproteobacteria bacterium]MBT4544223.1 hypothetical protein [Alphaproteobacteria bacterium]MBT7744445.1 hypothetical protein [Alphaproteobacteria bacterium]
MSSDIELKRFTAECAALEEADQLQKRRASLSVATLRRLEAVFELNRSITIEQERKEAFIEDFPDLAKEVQPTPVEYTFPVDIDSLTSSQVIYRDGQRPK